MKKQTIGKKISVAALSLAMITGLVSCSAGNASNPGASNAGPSANPASGAAAASYRIAIVQQMEHPSLDEIREAVEAELDAKAAELGISITYQEFSGNNDANLLDQLGAQIVSDGYDAVIPIASLAAQRMVNATEDSKTPVIYAAVSDPETAGITGMDRVTGTSDALNTAFLLDMMLAQNPQVKTVGLLYCPSEDSSAKPIADAKAYLKEKGIEYVEKTGTNASEVIAAAASLAGKVDAVFTPTDNTVASTELTIAQTFIEAGIPHYTGADSFVRNGAFTTCGVSYTQLGAYTADMALDVLQTGAVPEHHVMDGGIITVNTETAAALHVDYSVFQTMADTVIEVVTTED